jgi:hypothetical protein
MLFDPEHDEGLGQPDADREQLVHPGMAARAQGDEMVGGIEPRLTVMYRNPVGASTDPASVSVALQHFLAPAAKFFTRVRPAAVATSAQIGDGWQVGSAAAEQDSLYEGSIDRNGSGAHRGRQSAYHAEVLSIKIFIISTPLLVSRITRRYSLAIVPDRALT